MAEKIDEFSKAEKNNFAYSNIDIDNIKLNQDNIEYKTLYEQIFFNILSGNNILLHGDNILNSKLLNNIIDDISGSFNIRFSTIKDFDDISQHDLSEKITNIINDIYNIEKNKTVMSVKLKDPEDNDSIWPLLINLDVENIKKLDELFYHYKLDDDSYGLRFINDKNKEFPLPKSFRLFIIMNENLGSNLDRVFPTRKNTISFIPIDISEKIDKYSEKTYFILDDVDENIVDNKIPRNLIVYGAPGTGKSFLLEQLRLGEEKYIYGKDKLECNFKNPKLYRRVTFYPGYTYSKFIGTYKPITDDKDNILYEFIPGPFLELLCYAIKNPKHNFLLLIEEINRAKVSEVFADVFQLLDRIKNSDQDNENGQSEYSIVFEREVMKYLQKHNIIDSLNTPIKLPSNFYIWATMNNSDQGVMPLDTAFKRRWKFKNIKLNENQDITKDWKLKLNYWDNKHISWNKFREIINNRLKSRVTEDKLIGPFFLSENELENHDSLENKLFMYLREDVLRHDYNFLFRNDLDTFSDIIEEYNKLNSDGIFIEKINDALNENATEIK